MTTLPKFGNNLAIQNNADDTIAKSILKYYDEYKAGKHPKPKPTVDEASRLMKYRFNVDHLTTSQWRTIVQGYKDGRLTSAHAKYAVLHYGTSLRGNLRIDVNKTSALSLDFTHAEHYPLRKLSFEIYKRDGYAPKGIKDIVNSLSRLSYVADMCIQVLFNEFGLTIDNVATWFFGTPETIDYDESIYYADPYTLDEYVRKNKVDPKQLRLIKSVLVNAEKHGLYYPMMMNKQNNVVAGLLDMYYVTNDEKQQAYAKENEYTRKEFDSFKDLHADWKDSVSVATDTFVSILRERTDAKMVSHYRRALINTIDNILEEQIILGLDPDEMIPTIDSNIYYKEDGVVSLGRPNYFEGFYSTNTTMPSSHYYVYPVKDTTEAYNKEARKRANISEYLPYPKTFDKLDIPLIKIKRQHLENEPYNKKYHEGTEEWFKHIIDYRSPKLNGVITEDEPVFVSDPKTDEIKVKVRNRLHPFDKYVEDLHKVEDWIEQLKASYTPVEPILLTPNETDTVKEILNTKPKHTLYFNERTVRKKSLCVCECESMFEPEEREYEGKQTTCNCRCHTRAKRLTPREIVKDGKHFPDDKLVKKLEYRNRKLSNPVRVEYEPKEFKNTILEPKDYKTFKKLIEEFPYYEIVNYYQGNPPLSEPEFDSNGKKISTPEATIRYFLKTYDITDVNIHLRAYNPSKLFDLTPIILEDTTIPETVLSNIFKNEITFDGMTDTVSYKDTHFKQTYHTHVDINKENEMKLTPEQQKELDTYTKKMNEVTVKLRTDLNMSVAEFKAMQDDSSHRERFREFKENYLNDANLRILKEDYIEASKLEAELEEKDVDDVFCDCCEYVEHEFQHGSFKYFEKRENFDNLLDELDCEEPCVKCITAFDGYIIRTAKAKSVEEFDNAFQMGAFDRLDIVKAFRKSVYHIEIPVKPKFSKEDTEESIFELDGSKLIKAPDSFYFAPMSIEKDAPTVFDLVLPNSSSNEEIIQALDKRLTDNSEPAIVRGAGQTKWIIKNGVTYRMLESKKLGAMKVVTLITDEEFNKQMKRKSKLEHEKSEIMQETQRMLDSMNEEVEFERGKLEAIRNKATSALKPFEQRLLLRGIGLEDGKVVDLGKTAKDLIHKRLFQRVTISDTAHDGITDTLTKRFESEVPNRLSSNVDIGLLITLLFQDKLVKGIEEVSGEAVAWLKPTAEALRDYYDSDPTFASYLESVTHLAYKHIDGYSDVTLPNMLRKMDITELTSPRIAANILKHVRQQFDVNKTSILKRALADDDTETLSAFKEISKDEIFLDALERAYQSKDVDVIKSLLSAKANMEVNGLPKLQLLNGRDITEESVMHEALTILEGIKSFRLSEERTRINNKLSDIIEMRVLFPISAVAQLNLAYALEQRFKINCGVKNLIGPITDSITSLRTIPEAETRLVNSIVAISRKVSNNVIKSPEALIVDLGHAIEKGIATRGEYVSISNGNIQLAETFMIEDGLTRELYNRAISIIRPDDARAFAEIAVEKAMNILTKYNVKRLAVESQILLSKAASGAIITVDELEQLKKSVSNAVEDLNTTVTDDDSVLISDEMTEDDYQTLDALSEKTTKLKTGFSLINGFTGGGLSPCDLVVVGALPGNHKTGMTMNLFLQMMVLNNGFALADENNNLPTAVWYSLEDKQDLVFRKMAQILMRLTSGVFVDLQNVKTSVLHKFIKQTANRHGWRFMFQFLNPANTTATNIEQRVERLNDKGANLTILSIDYMGKMSARDQEGGVQAQQLKNMTSQVRNLAVRNRFLLMTPWQLGPDAGRKKQLEDDKPYFITTLADAQSYKDITDLKTEIDLEILVDRVTPIAKGYPYAINVTRGKEKDTSGATAHTADLSGFIPFNKQSGTAPLASDVIPVYDDNGKPLLDEFGNFVSKKLKHGYETDYRHLKLIDSVRTKTKFYIDGTKESVPHYQEALDDFRYTTLEQLNALIGLDKFGNPIPNKWNNIINITPDDITNIKGVDASEVKRIDYLPPMEVKPIKAKEEVEVKTPLPLLVEETLLDRVTANPDVYLDAVSRKEINQANYKASQRDNHRVNKTVNTIKSTSPAMDTTLLNKSIQAKTVTNKGTEFLPTDVKNQFNTTSITETDVRTKNKIVDMVHDETLKHYEELKENAKPKLDKERILQGKAKKKAEERKQQKAKTEAEAEAKHMVELEREYEHVKRERAKKKQQLSKEEVSDKFRKREFKRKTEPSSKLLETNTFSDDD